jgi:hypothetical protein
LGRIVLCCQPDLSVDRSHRRDSDDPHLLGFRLQGVPRQDARERLGMMPRSRQVIWFAAIYLMSIGAIAIATLVIRTVLRHIM